MRCPSCGTENEGDSRFCGGCGARIVVSEAPRVAPTVKVLDDAPYPPQVSAPPMRPSTHPSASRAPTPVAAHLYERPLSQPPSMPPTGSGRPSRAQSPALSNPPQMSEPALSMPIVRRPWGLIAVVIIVDLALAGTGAVLLAKGLSKSAAAPAKPAPAPAPAAAAPAPPPPPPPAPVVTPIDAAAAAAEPPKAEPPPQKVEAKKPPPKKTGKPEDPYGPAELNNEVELHASRSQSSFAKCAHDADAAAPVHGDIKISFQVLPSGKVTNAQPVVNTTGSPALASCLVSIMVRWTFAAKPAAATDFVRPFSYP